MRWPFGVAMSPRSSRICMTIAVEVSTKPAPATKDDGDRESRRRRRPPVSSSAQTPTCSAPSPKISRLQAPQPRGLHLQPDDEQEHHDAEFGDVQDRLGIGEDAQARTGR